MTGKWIDVVVFIFCLWFGLGLLIEVFIRPILASRRRKWLSKLLLAGQQEARTERRKTADKERERIRILRERDPLVDGIIAKVIRARLSLDRIVTELPDDQLHISHVADLRQWMDNHKEVMDFGHFQEITHIIGDSLPHENGEILRILEDASEFEAECIHYADERLGIHRTMQLVDGDREGGLMYEKAIGGYEYVHKRYERVMLRLPGADRGYIYILTNESMPGLLKIGQTREIPEKRAINLSGHTGVPSPFRVVYSTVVGNRRLVEKITQQRLSLHRVSGKREFFSMSVTEAISVIEEVSREIERRENLG